MGPAVIDPAGTWSAGEIRRDAAGLAEVLGPRPGERIGLLCTPGHDFVVGLLATWRVGAVAVPLHPDHPAPELAYFVEDSGASLVLCSADHEAAARQVGPAVVLVGAPAAAVGTRAGTAVVEPDPRAPAMLVYTSGTTGRPKGAVHTHGGLAAQVDALLTAWAWSADDRILLVLPLHHVHGIMAVCLCAWTVGATCEAPGRFDPIATWERLASGELTLLMAVPTIYARLVTAWEAADEDTRARWSDGAAGLRLMVSGSAALPVPTLERWRQITGQVLLERYGMTEFGMALSNTLDRRVPGHVGEPLPGIEVRLVDETGADVDDGVAGELLVRGRAVCDGYWGRPEATAEAFLDGWFRTGDVAVHEPDGYRILGRSSVDIIKTGGEKVSALEIEDAYRAHEQVADCAVVGLPDQEWGQVVALAYVAVGDTGAAAEALRAWGRARLAPAKVPKRFLAVAELPRNAMGKVTKPAVVELFPT